ncbi:MAG: chaperone NapD [Rhizobiales bacterium]|nr:chaperone NapD [Hyphomicrobiales bacterium]
MAGGSQGTKVGRRDFISSRWGAASAASTVEIASVLVQTWPERLDAAERAIEALSGVQIYSRDPKGKLIVVIEGSDTGAIGTALNRIALMPDVLTAALVFQGTDTG